VAEIPPIDVSDPPEPAPVIPLRAPATLGSELKVVRGGNHCQHRTVLIDDNKRTVECGDCNALLDPFAELSKVAHRHERIAYELKAAKRETKALAGRIELMKRVESSARARLKRFVDELPTKYQLNELLEETLRAWEREGKIIISQVQVLTPDGARDAARRLVKLAREAEKSGG
jgi:hypothetical protein